MIPFLWNFSFKCEIKDKKKQLYVKSKIKKNNYICYYRYQYPNFGVILTEQINTRI